MEKNKNVAALFDLDGVVFDTEPQYTEFWGSQCQLYHPEIPDLEYKIKGMTLDQIYHKYFDNMIDEQRVITERLNDFERNMQFNFIPGFEAFIKDIRKNNVKTAIVTSSNLDKMGNVYRQIPSFQSLFDSILTSEMFSKSKPDPDCYQKGAKLFDAPPANCVVFEDSFNGLKSGNAAGATVIGLATTNTENDIRSLCKYVISDYRYFGYQKMMSILCN